MRLGTCPVNRSCHVNQIVYAIGHAYNLICSKVTLKKITFRMRKSISCRKLKIRMRKLRYIIDMRWFRDGEDTWVPKIT